MSPSRISVDTVITAIQRDAFAALGMDEVSVLAFFEQEKQRVTAYLSDKPDFLRPDADILAEAASEFNPSSLCNYSFQLAQLFNSFYDAHSISKAESAEKKNLRLMIIIMTASVLRHAMGLLGIRMPEKM